MTRDHSQELELTILMPCLNEQNAVGDCVKEASTILATAGVYGEILVVDNASTDGSGDLAAAEGARVIHEPRKGYGYA